MSITAGHRTDTTIVNTAYIHWLTSICDDEQATRLLRQCGNPRSALRRHLKCNVEFYESLEPWIHRATIIHRRGIRPITPHDGLYPRAWRTRMAVPPVIWQRHSTSVTAPKAVVFGGLTDAASAIAPAGAVGAWLASRRVTVMGLADADAAGAAALKAARIASRGNHVLPILTSGLLADQPGVRSPFPMGEWASVPMQSIAPPMSLDTSDDAVDHAARTLLSRADAVIITGATARLDVSETVRQSGVPVIVLGIPTSWAIDLVADRVARRAHNLSQLTHLLQSRKRHAASAA